MLTTGYLVVSTLGSADNWLSALQSVLHHICSTWNPFDLRHESVTYNIVMHYPQNEISFKLTVLQM